MWLLFAISCQSQSDTAQARQFGDIIFDQQRSGDPDEGLDYLLYGDYLGSGVPKDVFFQFIPPVSSNPLGREGESAGVPYAFTLFTAPNDVEVVGGINCFGCHSSVINGEYIIGLGNAFSDYTEPDTSYYSMLSTFIINSYGEDSPEYKAFEYLGKGSQKIGPRIVMPFAGVNPAVALEEAVAMHRDPQTFAWQDTPRFDNPTPAPGSDVPPWWNVKKKHALYYNTVGRGDFARLIMQTCVVGVWDSDHAQDIDEHFPDVLAFLNSIEPPTFPDQIDEALANQGEALFQNNCSSCHGTYGSTETYPNTVVHIDELGTDATLARGYQDSATFTEWLKESWFTNEPHAARFIPELGYIAPPLDGIWATAPYLHNGSVPNLWTLLSSSERPTYWSRNFESSVYDTENIGWPYETETEASTGSTYDTTLTGYSNTGHTYGDHLSPDERWAVIEYLKSL